MLLFHQSQLCFWKATFSAGAPLSVPGASWVGSQGGFGGLGCSLGESWEVRMLLFRWFQMVFCDVMLFDVFSQVFRSDVVFPKAKEREVVMLLLGRQNVAISLVSAMFLERHVFRRCVLNEFRSRFQWKIVCSGGAQELKTVEILVRK